MNRRVRVRSRVRWVGRAWTWVRLHRDAGHQPIAAPAIVHVNVNVNVNVNVSYLRSPLTTFAVAITAPVCLVACAAM